VVAILASDIITDAMWLRHTNTQLGRTLSLARPG